jgi:RHS repeat-associated protein
MSVGFTLRQFIGFRLSLAIFLLAFCFAASASAQNTYVPTLPDNTLTPADPIGVPPFVSSTGTHETINLSSGGLTVFLKALTLPQRGGWNMTLGYFHNSNTYSLEQNVQVAPVNNNESGKVFWGDFYTYYDGMNSPYPPLQINLPTLEASIEYMGDQQLFNPLDTSSEVNQFPVACVTNWTFTDWSGNKHSFGGFKATCSQETCPQNSFCHSVIGQLGTPTTSSTDGSWLYLDTTNKSDIQVTTKDGTVYHFTSFVDPYPNASSGTQYGGAQNTEHYYRGVFSSLVDTNGNSVSVQTSQSTYTLTDTIGRIVTIAPSGITYKDSSGQSRTISLTVGSSSTTSYSFGLSCSHQGSPNYNAPFSPPVINISQSVAKTAPYTMDLTFPAVDSTNTSRNYHMQFDTLSRLMQINYPSGGYTKYDYQTLMLNQQVGQITCLAPLMEVAHKRECTLSSGNCSNSQELVTTYAPTGAGGTIPSNGAIDETDPLGTRTHHSYTNAPAAGQFAPRETDTTIYNSSGTLLRTVHYDYTGMVTSQDLQLPTAITTTLNDVSPTISSVEQRQYQLASSCQNCVSIYYDNPTEIDEYDYDGSLKKKTAQTWEPTSNFTPPHILDRLATRTVTDPISGVQSTLSYGYNSVGDITSGTVGGTGITSLTTNYQRDSFGNITQITDPKLNITKFGYQDSWKDTSCAPSSNSSAYLTSITDALNQVWNFTYYSCTGLKGTARDPNDLAANRAGTTSTFDPLGRILSTTFPDGGQTTLTYVDATPNSVSKTSLIASGLNLTSNSIFDGFARTSQTQLTSDPDGPTYTVTTYDALGRVSQTYNPTRCSTPTTQCTTSPSGYPENTWGITTVYYDALGRTCLVVPPDGTLPSGSGCPAPTAQPSNTVLTTYSGNTTTVTDQAGKSRKSIKDALGRLTQVFEDPAGVNYETDYGYDAFGNLLCAGQKGTNTGTFSGCSSIPSSWRPRTFSYDSLSRLLSATNPESGTITYSYDADGNLLQKTSPAPNQTGTATVTLSYCYDALNRVTGKAYTAQTCSNGLLPSPLVSYFYDQSSYNGLAITNGIGRRTGMSDQSGIEAWSYDSMGRPLTDQRTTAGITKSIPYTYNLDGSLASLTYRADHYPFILTYTPGGAGRPISSSAPSFSFAYNVHYAPNGSLCSIYSAWGQEFRHDYTFNNRLQPINIQAWDTGSMPAHNACTTVASGNGDELDLTYSYVDVSNHDNGNVISIANNMDTHRTQQFSYDSLNRLSSANTLTTNQPMWQGDTNALPNCWAENYSYDAWGNLTVIAPFSSSYTGCSQESGFNFSNGGISTKNQIAVSGYGYDAAGNLTAAPPTGNTYVYDAENHLTSAGGVAYLYDGDGKRVGKAPVSTPTTPNYLYWYGTGSNILEETDGTGNYQYLEYYFNGMRLARSKADNWVDHFFTDALGNSRCVYGEGNPDGGCSDYYPFGGERPILDGGVNVSFKFTGKERDAESGLDNFGARYMTNSFGRFMSTDPAMKSVNGTNPQTWNRYAYVLNNPLRFVDPFGLWAISFDDVYDKKGKLKHRNIIVKKSKEGDDAASLAKQLGFKGKDADKLAAQLTKKYGDSDSLQLSKLGGIVGRTFDTAEQGVTAQAQYLANGGDPTRGPSSILYNDCSMTCARIAAPSDVPLSGDWGIQSMNNLIHQLGFASVSSGEERTGDIIRWGADAKTHFANVLFTGDDGITQVFSRSGVDGRFEIVPEDNSGFQHGYGDITGRFRPRE